MFPIEVTPSSSQSVTTATSHQLVSGLAVDNGPFISSSIQVPRYQPHQLYPTRLRLKTKTAALPDQSSHALSKPNLPFAPCTARVPYTRTYAARRYFLAIQPTSRAGQTADLANRPIWPMHGMQVPISGSRWFRGERRCVQGW